jgi:hypothetical protein
MGERVAQKGNSMSRMFDDALLSGYMNGFWGYVARMKLRVMDQFARASVG